VRAVLIKGGQAPRDPNDYRCKHILLCRRVAAYELLDRVLEARRLNEKETNPQSHGQAAGADAGIQAPEGSLDTPAGKLLMLDLFERMAGGEDQ
jgi:hypothetical protein